MLFTQFIQTVKYSSVHIQHCILNASKLVFKGIRMRKSLNSRQKSRKSLYDTFCFLATVAAKKRPMSKVHVSQKTCSIFQQVLRYECKYFKPSENAFEMNFNTFVMYSL